jgi:hypothetical protein
LHGPPARARRHPEEPERSEGTRDPAIGAPRMPSARGLPGTGSLAVARDDGANDAYGPYSTSRNDFVRNAAIWPRVFELFGQ